MTALTLTILEYYAWKKSRNKSQVIRALITAFPRVDPEFDFDELEWFAEKLVYPALKDHPEAMANLKTELKRFREREYTTHTSMLFESGPNGKKETKSDEKRADNIKSKTDTAKKKTKKPSQKRASLAERVAKWGGRSG